MQALHILAMTGDNISTDALEEPCRQWVKCALLGRRFWDHRQYFSRAQKHQLPHDFTKAVLCVGAVLPK